MSTRHQVAVSLVLVLGAISVVAVRVRSGESGPLAAEDAGHDHAAMTAASGELSPVVLDAEGSRRIGVTFAT